MAAVRFCHLDRDQLSCEQQTHMKSLTNFKTAILASSEREIERDSGLGGQLQLLKDGRFSVDYAPFEYVQPKARIVIAGITPGSLQAKNALKKARQVLLRGGSEAEAIKLAKVFASFSGPMRINLVAMLDHIGVHRFLGIPSTDQLWSDQNELAHFTSVLRNPVYYDNKNYSGTPPMDRHPVLTGMLDTLLCQEASTLPHALWVPLGPAASTGLEWIVKKGILRTENVLWGLPHPSGANGERIAYFLQRKNRGDLSTKTAPDRIDQGREKLTSQVAALRNTQAKI